MKRIIRNLTSIIAVTISVPLTFVFLIHTNVKENNFFNNTVSPLFYNTIIEQGPKWILKSEQFVSFPENIKQNISEQDLEKILKKHVTPESVQNIISSVQQQIKEIDFTTSSLVTISIPLDFIFDNQKEISQSITESVINDLPKCQNNTDFSSTNLNCIPSDVLGINPTTAISSILEERYLNRLPKNLPISFQLPEFGEQANSISTIKDFFLNTKTILYIIIAIFLFFTTINVFTVRKISDKIQQLTSILLKSTSANLTIFIPTYIILKQFNTQSEAQNIFINSIAQALMPIIVILSAITIAALLFKLIVHFSTKPKIESE